MSVRLSRHLVDHRRRSLAALAALAAGLELAAAVGLSSMAGFGTERAALAGFQPGWLLGTGMCALVSMAGYGLVYREIFSSPGGPSLRLTQLAAVVVAGFGGFLGIAGGALDIYALEAAGTARRDAGVRVAALGGLELGMLGVVACGAAIVALTDGLTAPPATVQWPWAIVPAPGFFVAFWLAGRKRERQRSAGGWRRSLSVWLDAIAAIRHMVRHPLSHGTAPSGMILFWLADLLAAWCAQATFGFQMNGAAFVLGFATGAVFTRRTGPLGGAGVLMVVLPVTLWYAGAPLPVAVAGIFVFRVFTLWLPLPFAFTALPTLRHIGEPQRKDMAGNAHERAADRGAG